MNSPQFMLIGLLIHGFWVTAAIAHPSVRLLTYNVQFDSLENQKTLELIREQSPDVLCLQELTPVFEDQLKRSLSSAFAHSVADAREGTWGIGIYSRFPIRQAQIFPQLPHRMPGAKAFIKLPNGEEVQLLCVHWFPPIAKRDPSWSYLQAWRENRALRMKQADNLAHSGSSPVLIAGDLNEGGDGEGVLRLLARGFTDSCSAAKTAECGSTWPGASYWFLPALFRIDHILGKEIEFKKIQRIRGGGSDHFPVLAEF